MGRGGPAVRAGSCLPIVPQTARVQALCGRGEPLPWRPGAQAHPRRQRAGRSLKTGARRAGSAGRGMLGARRSTPQHEAYGGGRDASPPVDNAYGRWGGLWTKRGGPAGRPGEPRMWPFSSWPRGSWAH